MIPVHQNEIRMDKGDKSASLTLAFSEQQWITVGIVIAQRLRVPDCHPVEKENLLPVALRLQQTINRIWRDSWPAESWSQGLPIVNFAAQENDQLDEEYLYGNSWN
jgi:hypothetical protein